MTADQPAQVKSTSQEKVSNTTDGEKIFGINFGRRDEKAQNSQKREESPASLLI